MKFLFIGNSHTYFNDMPEIFRKICEENKVNAEVFMLAHGGKGFDFHKNEPEVRFNILYGNYDYIILQHCAHPFENVDNMFSSAQEIDMLISQTSSKKVLYMTWTEKDNKKSQPEMSLAYNELGEMINAIVAPVGNAWWQFNEKYPNIELYYEDGQHASEIGSTLAAYTIFNSIFSCQAKCSNELNEKICLEAYNAVHALNQAVHVD